LACDQPVNRNQDAYDLEGKAATTRTFVMSKRKKKTTARLAYLFGCKKSDAARAKKEEMNSQRPIMIGVTNLN